MSSGLRVLEVDAELGRDLDADTLAEARRSIVLPAFQLRAGPWDVAALFDHAEVRGVPFGVLIVDGAVIADLRIAGRSCARLFVGGDLVLFDPGAPETLPTRWAWSVEADSRVIVLDDRMLAVGARWPRVAGRLYRRAARQVRQGFVLQAIAQLPRIEDRLLALFWCVAERAGRRGPEGVRVPLSITHEGLGRMVGAQRPTVSLALKELAARRLLRRGDGGWLLTSGSVRIFEPDGESDRRSREPRDGSP
jgi:CRP/FNR family cyclic AMP-dependent transcriptional regulator